MSTDLNQHISFAINTKITEGDSLDRFEFKELHRLLISHCPKCDGEIFEGDEVNFHDGEFICIGECTEQYTYETLGVTKGRVNKYGEIE